MNIHVLMALAAFASVFMGNALEGGLLLAMFNLAHIGKPFSFATIWWQLAMCIDHYVLSMQLRSISQVGL